MACGSESPIFRCWTKTTAACLSRMMEHGSILRMVMLIPSIREWHRMRMAGGTSRTEQSTGIIPGWQRMKTAGGTIVTEISTGTTPERGPASTEDGIIGMAVFHMI